MSFVPCPHPACTANLKLPEGCEGQQFSSPCICHGCKVVVSWDDGRPVVELENSAVIDALRAAQQYQRDWQEHGISRVHKYFEDVEGNWLEEFEEIEAP